MKTRTGSRRLWAVPSLPIALLALVASSCSAKRVDRRPARDTAELRGWSRVIVTVAGRTPDIGDGGPATKAQLSLPGAIAFDALGNAYLGEGSGHRVRKIDTAGTITTFAGIGGSGYNGDDIPAAEAQLNIPRGITFDSKGDLYIVENGGNRVRRVDMQTKRISTFAKDLQGPGFITFDPLGAAYVSEVTGNRILKGVPPGYVLAPFAGTGAPGSQGDGLPATAAQFRGPNAIVYDPLLNRLYITDVNNNRVRMVDAGLKMQPFAGDGTVGPAGDNGPALSAQLSTPRTIARDPAGNVFIADFKNHRVRMVDGTQFIRPYAGTGVPGALGDGGPAQAAQLNGPSFVAFDAKGDLYIVESLGQRVRKVDKTTQSISLFAGGGTPDLGDGGPATAAQFDPSGAVAFDACGNFYVADLNNNRVRRVDRATGIVTTVAGTGVTGSAGDGGPAIAAELNGPFAVALDGSGNLYVAESTGRCVRKVDPAGRISRVAGTGVSGSLGDGGPATAAQLNNPQGLAVSGTNLYVSEFAGHRVRKVDLVTGLISRVAGTGVPGSLGDGGSAKLAQLNSPQGLAVDSAGNLYVADAGNTSIRKVAWAEDRITRVAGTGVSGALGDGGLAVAAQLNTPQSVAVDASGNLYIADVGNNRVRRVDTKGFITTVAGSGKAGFSGDGGDALAARLNGPRGVAIDPWGRLHVTDSANGRIRRLDPTATCCR